MCLTGWPSGRVPTFEEKAMANASLYIDAGDGNVEFEGNSFLTDPARVQVEYAESDGTRECQHCRTRVELVSVKDDSGKWTEQWEHNDGKRECDPQLVAMHDPDLDPDEDNLRVAEPISEGASEIVNSASLNFDDEHMGCTVTISVGDPRGAFAMTVRRLENGKLILHVPYEADPLPHMPLRKLHEGTYEILNH